MRVVLDTSALVASLRRMAGGKGSFILLHLFSPLFTLLVDARIVAEYRNVLYRPRILQGLQTEYVETVLQFFEKHAPRVVAERLSLPLPDEGDRPFIEVALAGGADMLITYNKKDFPTLCQVRMVDAVEAAEVLHGHLIRARLAGLAPSEPRMLRST